MGINISVKGKGGVLAYPVGSLSRLNLPLTAVKVSITQVLICFIIVADVGISTPVKGKGGVLAYVIYTVNCLNLPIAAVKVGIL